MLLCPWNSPGKNTGMGCHSLLQEIFLTQGLNLSLLNCREIISEPPGKPQRTVSMMLNNTTPHVHFNHFRKSPSDQLPVSKITLFWLNFWLLLEYRYFLFWHKWDITLPLEKVMDMCSHCFSPFSSGTISQDDSNFPPFKSRIFFF